MTAAVVEPVSVEDDNPGMLSSKKRVLAGAAFATTTLACVVALALSMCARPSPSRSPRVVEPVSNAATDKIEWLTIAS